jgi:hypothetical protein
MCNARARALELVVFAVRHAHTLDNPFNHFFERSDSEARMLDEPALHASQRCNLGHSSV